MPTILGEPTCNQEGIEGGCVSVQAIKRDPIGKPMRTCVGTLYNAAGMKDKAAIEYEEFLKKKPDYPDSKKLRDYIAANKK